LSFLSLYKNAAHRATIPPRLQRIGRKFLCLPPQVKYGKALTGGASHPATFVRIYDIFGPTYPGEYDEENRMYSLHYPGVVFLFPIPEQHAQRCKENQVELPLEFTDGSSPLAARICVHAAAEGKALCSLDALSIEFLLWQASYAVASCSFLTSISHPDGQFGHRSMCARLSCVEWQCFCCS
jgi:hypothetical protein